MKLTAHMKMPSITAPRWRKGEKHREAQRIKASEAKGDLFKSYRQREGWNDAGPSNDLVLDFKLPGVNQLNALIADATASLSTLATQPYVTAADRDFTALASTTDNAGTGGWLETGWGWGGATANHVWYDEHRWTYVTASAATTTNITIDWPRFIPVGEELLADAVGSTLYTIPTVIPAHCDHERWPDEMLTFAGRNPALLYDCTNCHKCNRRAFASCNRYDLCYSCQQRRAKEYEKAQKEAERVLIEARADTTLKTLLTPGQIRSLEMDGHIWVQGASGKKYRIKDGVHHGGVSVFSEGLMIERVCSYADEKGLPKADSMAAHLLAIKYDEDYFREKANITKVA